MMPAYRNEFNMDTTGLEFRIKTADPFDIRSHLEKCQDGYVPPLSETVDIGKYAEKLHAQATTFEAWIGPELVGMTAAYLNDHATGAGYITNTSVLPDYRGKGMADKLMAWCIQHARENGFKEVMCRVNKDNRGSIGMCKKSGFVDFRAEGDLIVMRIVL
jgi:ribosomal protein S18 acetylase RimI-like enzyme